MKNIRTLVPLFATGLLALTVSAQSGTPISDPPPPAPAATPADPAIRATGEVNITESTNSTGKTSGNGSLRELRFAAVDANADGMISLGEFKTFMEAGNVARATTDASTTSVNPTEVLFRQIDRNNDNLLSEAEVTAYQDEQDRAAKR